MSLYPTSRRPARALPIVVCATIAFSLFPAPWLKWTADLSDLTRLPVTPIAHIGVLLTGWVRPSMGNADLPTDGRDRVELAIAEKELWEQLYRAQLLKATELAAELRDLQALPESALRNPTRPLSLPVDITGIRSNNTTQEVELKLTRGVLGRIREGDLAIIGQDVVGRISRVSSTRVMLRPTTNEHMGYIRGSIVPPEPALDRQPILATVLLQPEGKPYLYSEAPLTSGIAEGDLVVVDDSSWPEISKGLVIGVVEHIEQLDEAPLRQSIYIVPRKRIRDVSRLFVLGSGEDVAE